MNIKIQVLENRDASDTFVFSMLCLRST